MSHVVSIINFCPERCHTENILFSGTNLKSGIGPGTCRFHVVALTGLSAEGSCAALSLVKMFRNKFCVSLELSSFELFELY